MDAQKLHIVYKIVKVGAFLRQLSPNPLEKRNTRDAESLSRDTTTPDTIKYQHIYIEHAVGITKRTSSENFLTRIASNLKIKKV
jgi:hypothetical protein